MSDEVKSPEPSPKALAEATQADFLEWLSPVQDPELFLSLVELGLIYSVEAAGDSVSVTMTLTSPGCPSADYLVTEVKRRLMQYPGVKNADVRIIFEPKWDPRTMASDAVKDQLGIW